jgi:hypothetical protein
LPAPQALSAPNCCACNFAAARGIESRLLRPHPHRRKRGDQPGEFFHGCTGFLGFITQIRLAQMSSNPI